MPFWLILDTELHYVYINICYTYISVYIYVVSPQCHQSSGCLHQRTSRTPRLTTWDMRFNPTRFNSRRLPPVALQVQLQAIIDLWLHAVEMDSTRYQSKQLIVRSHINRAILSSNRVWVLCGRYSWHWLKNAGRFVAVLGPDPEVLPKVLEIYIVTAWSQLWQACFLRNQACIDWSHIKHDLCMYKYIYT